MKFNFIKQINTLTHKFLEPRFQKKLKNLNLIFSFACLYILFKFSNEFDFKESFSNLTTTQYIACSLFYFSNGLLWVSFMKKNFSIGLKELINNWSYSKLGKYFPGSLMIFTVRLNQDIKDNENPRDILYGILEEHFLTPIVAMATIGVSLFFYQYFTNIFIFIISSIFLFLFLRYFYLKIEFNFVSISSSAFIFLFHLNMNFLFFYSVATTLEIENQYLFTLLYFLSSCFAIFFIGVPSGIGIRELFFYLLSMNLVSEDIFIDMAIKVRILTISFDFFVGSIGLIRSNFKK